VSTLYDTDAEIALIGAVLIHNDVMDDLTHINRGDFYSAANGEVWSAILHLYANDKSIDEVTVCSRLRQQHALERAGGASEVAFYSNRCPSYRNATEYAERVRELSALRSITQWGNHLVTRAQEDGVNYRELIDDIGNESVDIVGNRQDEARTIGEYAREALDASLAAADAGGQVAGLSSGLVDLDHKTGGFHPGELTIIAARPSMGKSALAFEICRKLSAEQGIPTAFFSLEMPGRSLGARALASMASVPNDFIRKGRIEKHLEVLATITKQLSDAPLYIDEGSALTSADIRGRTRKMVRKSKVQLIVVDYLQLMGGKARSREEEVSGHSRGLKALAKECDIPVIALSQLNRQCEQRGDKRPMLSDLRESGAIEQDADAVMFLYRDEVYDKNTADVGVAEIIIGKQRNGPTGIVRTKFTPKYTRFDNLMEYQDNF